MSNVLPTDEALARDIERHLHVPREVWDEDGWDERAESFWEWRKNREVKLNDNAGGVDRGKL